MAKKKITQRKRTASIVGRKSKRRTVEVRKHKLATSILERRRKKLERIAIIRGSSYGYPGDYDDPGAPLLISVSPRLLKQLKSGHISFDKIIERQLKSRLGKGRLIEELDTSTKYIVYYIGKDEGNHKESR